MDLQTIIVPLWSANVFKWAFWGAILGYLGQCFDRYLYISNYFYIYRICMYIYIYREYIEAPELTLWPFWQVHISFLKLTANAPENEMAGIQLFPLGIRPFLRCELLVSGWLYMQYILYHMSQCLFAGQGCLFVILRPSYPFRMADLTAI